MPVLGMHSDFFFKSTQEQNSKYTFSAGYTQANQINDVGTL